MDGDETIPGQQEPEAQELARELLDMVGEAREAADEDPFGNPVLSVALAIMRRIDDGRLDTKSIRNLVCHLRDIAFADRARRLAAYVGGVDAAANTAALERVAEVVLRPDPADSPVRWGEFCEAVQRTRYAAVFTAHPTFSLPLEVGTALAGMACGEPEQSFASHRPRGITLEGEFAQANAAIARGRDALDAFNAALLRAACASWPDRWTELAPRPLVLSSWVGYDTDGRTDITWLDMVRLRLRMKKLQLERLAGQIDGIAEAGALGARLTEALAAVGEQIEAVPAEPRGPEVAWFAKTLIETAERALRTTAPLLELFEPAIEAAAPEAQLALCVARAGLVAHGLSLAHTHTRLNAAQVHNVVRQRLGISDSPDDPARRRALLAQINAALDNVEPVAVDFGAVLAEQASAATLMMTISQLVKHVDASTPVRFLIAETESGYTLLAALWLARLFGVADHVEISPLFETAEALGRGAEVLDEALRSPHYRAYLKRTGRLALQFGYSDSGRFVGQMAATYLIERLRLKIAATLERHGVSGVEVILFDTHGESVGRGAHPGSMASRLRYLSPTASRHALNHASLPVREETAFQGGDGYLLFGTPGLALATVARIAEHAFHPSAGRINDPVYDDPDFASDFFATIRVGMEGLVDDAGYGALLGAFGPSLLDRTGSRPPARQTDGMGASVHIHRPHDLRAIPNNAILQQLGWMANTLQGIGAAAARHPEVFPEMQTNSRRFHRALTLAEHALAHSDLDVLRAVVGTLDPGTWLDRAGHSAKPGRREALVMVARALERLGLWASTQAMFRRVQADHLALRAAWPDAPRMATREVLLHALRLALIHRIWMFSTRIPDFSPRHGFTRASLDAAILRLEIPGTLKLLAEIFPEAPDPSAECDYGEPAGPRASSGYAREKREVFEPIGEMFDIIREIAMAVTHEVGAFG